MGHASSQCMSLAYHDVKVGTGIQSGTRVPASWTDFFCLWSEKTEITYFVSTLLRSEPVLLCDHLAYCSTPSVVRMGIRISYKDFED